MTQIHTLLPLLRVCDFLNFPLFFVVDRTHTVHVSVIQTCVQMCHMSHCRL